MEFVIVLAVLAAVVVVVSAPLRRADEQPVSAAEELRVLEAAREAKYREIRDADLDHRTGKLSDDDFEAIDRSLRTEAIEILHALDSAEGTQAG
jgi:type II secretory pathway component PulM